MLDVLEYAVKQAEKLGASGAEAYGVQTRESEVFLENNDLKQAKSQTSSSLGIRVLLSGGSVGFYSVNAIDKARVSEAAGLAIKIGRISPKDKYNSLPTTRSKIPRLAGIWDTNAESFEPAAAVRKALEMLDSAKSYDDRVSVDSGNFVSAMITHGIANSNGIAAKEKASTFFWSLMGMALEGDEVSSFDVESGGTHHVKKIDVQKTGRDFAKSVVGSLGAKKIDSFKGELLLTPSAAVELVTEPMAHSINSEAVQRKTSHFAGKIGKKVASELLSAVDDPTNTEGLGASSFDREGVPHRKTRIIEKGVLKTFLYDTYTAKKAHTRSTGNAGGSASSPPSVSLSTFVIEPGKPKFETLLSETRNGILVSRFSGNVNPVNGDFSGVVKGGHLVKDGSKVHPVKEVLVAGNVFTLLKNLSGISRERKVLFDSILPYCRFDDVSFTAG